jgi:hypothetical protein
MESDVRVASQELHETMLRRFSGVKLESILYELSLPEKYSATIWRVMTNTPGVSWPKENEIREAAMMELLPPERDEYDPRTHEIVAKQGRQRAPRQAIEAHPEIIQLFRLERDRRGLTNTEMLQSLLRGN